MLERNDGETVTSFAEKGAGGRGADDRRGPQWSRSENGSQPEASNRHLASWIGVATGREKQKWDAKKQWKLELNCAQRPPLTNSRL